MKKVISLILILCLALTACGAKETKEETAKESTEEAKENTGIANPMVETDNDGLMEKLGFNFNLPKGAKDAKFYVIAGDTAECDFTMDGVEYTARMKAVPSYEDISGMYYKWDIEEDCQVGGREGKQMRVTEDGKTIDLVMWCDIVPGIMYSLSAQAKDLDGFDILAVAEEMFVPLQGDAG